MNRSRYAYLLIPPALLLAWAVVYLPWARTHPARTKIPVEELPPAIFVPPQPTPPEDGPEEVELRQRTKALEKRLLEVLVEESNARVGKGPATTPGNGQDGGPPFPRLLLLRH